jgi:hypothetical protein
MDPRHKTQKNATANATIITYQEEKNSSLKMLLEGGAREAYARPWHRLERGLRLNRLRLFLEDIAITYEMTEEEKIMCFVTLQKALDKKLLNTLKVVLYDQETQRIVTIKGLDIHRTPEGKLICDSSMKVASYEGTRKKKKVPSVSAPIATPDASLASMASTGSVAGGT